MDRLLVALLGNAVTGALRLARATEPADADRPYVMGMGACLGILAGLPNDERGRDAAGRVLFPLAELYVRAVTGHWEQSEAPTVPWPAPTLPRWATRGTRRRVSRARLTKRRVSRRRVSRRRGAHLPR